MPDKASSQQQQNDGGQKQQTDDSSLPAYTSTQAPPSYKPGRKSQGPASAAQVSSIMGPAPPKEDKMGFWERWKNDRREAKELKMPTQESSSKWGVKNFAGSC